MEFRHINSVFQSPVVQWLGHFVQDWHIRQTNHLPGFEELKREFHPRVLAIECKLLTTELAGYDVKVEQIDDTLFHDPDEKIRLLGSFSPQLGIAREPE